MSNQPALVNKVATAKFLRDRGIPVRECLRAAVILGDGGIGVREVADAFSSIEATYFQTVADVLCEVEAFYVTKDAKVSA